MATKTFKIGLSNTDKQNMAQDVYERLLALTFNEYDTTTEYEVGDFVVYNDQLYKCIGATSGAWDSTKWQLATLNDLVDDIENAVAFVNDKANVNGNYPTMTVGFADNLTPYDESAGDDQDEPFSFQATGTGNGTQPDFATGSGALMKEKQGNTVVVNQLAKALNATNWTFNNSTGTFSSGVATFTANAQDGRIFSNSVVTTSGKFYLIAAEIKTTTPTDKIKIDFTGYGSKYTSSSTNWQFLYSIMESPNSGNKYLRVLDTRSSDWDAIQVRNAICIDLTQWFNGDIPQDLLDHPDHFFRYYQGSLAYNAGELVNANGRYVKCIGRQQWDEEWELGGIETDGSLYPDTDRIRSKNYIRVIPNANYYFYRNGSNSLRICYYDKDYNFISYDSNANTTHTTPSNCSFIKIVIFGTTTYNNDITISLYYEGESGYDQYYPYEVLTNNDTGTEVLRSAGSVKDYKEPDGTIHRLVGVVDLGTLNWSYATDYNYFYANVPNIKNISSTSEKIGMICAKYITVTQNVWASNKPCICKTFSGNQILVGDDNYNDAATFKTAMSGVYLYFELATPTTEQGTTFSENLVIDDFGSQDFSGTSGVPQGNLIFYPVDYKAYIDTLYKYTDGAPSKIALKSDLPTAPQTWAESLPGYDATKTQTLKNVEGTLTWVDD